MCTVGDGLLTCGPHDCLTPERPGWPQLRQLRTGVRDYIHFTRDQVWEFDTVLVVNELVSNAIMHGTAPVTVALRLAQWYIRIEVGDGSPRAPELLACDLTGGYGLRLVDALADVWGFTPTANGKVVWAERRLATL